MKYTPHFALAVRDVASASALFQRTFGWHPIDRPSNINRPADWLAICPGQELQLVQVEGFHPSDFEGEFGRHIAVAYPRSGFAALKQRLRAEGADLIPPKRDTPFERFFFRGPEGYIFEVVESETPGNSK
jgi:catechol 2,3-dioxygenase-like lactoylglutathione lyase family enzyme